MLVSVAGVPGRATYIFPPSIDTPGSRSAQAPKGIDKRKTHASLSGSGMLASTFLISAGPKPVKVRLCLGRLNPGPTGPRRSAMGAPTEGLRSRRSDMIHSEKQNEEDTEEEKRGEGCKIWWHQAGVSEVDRERGKCRIRRPIRSNFTQSGHLSYFGAWAQNVPVSGMIIQFGHEL